MMYWFIESNAVVKMMVVTFGLCYDCVLLDKDISLLDCPVVFPYNIIVMILMYLNLYDYVAIHIWASGECGNSRLAVHVTIPV